MKRTRTVNAVDATTTTSQTSKPPPPLPPRSDHCVTQTPANQIHVCEGETLPEVLSEFWSIASELAQEKYSAMASDRDSHAAHALFVVPRCDLFKDYKIMRHLVSGGCCEFVS